MKNLFTIVFLLLSTLTFSQSTLSVSGVTVSVNKTSVTIDVPKHNGETTVSIVFLGQKNVNKFEKIGNGGLSENEISFVEFSNTGYKSTENNLEVGEYKIVVVKDGKTTSNKFEVKG
jgi:hypothetical protein